MTNFQIITNSAIEAGLYSKEEALAILEKLGSLPFHTFAEWKRFGFSVKKGEHAKLTCYIWKPKKKAAKVEELADKDDDDTTGDFFKVKAFFFDNTQVERTVTV